MQPRLNPYEASPDAMKALVAMDKSHERRSIAPALYELIRVRISQINGCAYCLDMHLPDARKAGISQQKLDVLAAWRESPAFDARERAALGWADALTRIEATGAPDADYDALAARFPDREIADLTHIIVSMNALNRIAIGFRAMHPVEKSEAA
ncbi:carboxymuconolactone decarboxylase family protein [Paracoccus sp. 11-3]|uniref:Carboxymuconolactone decarboxylase family protein n=1 Tax=Paracoccus amoyensis TaxID=2760093 RepID=A0A926GHV5_9RHOB|nr:carboxymuconolactone decarboxylase family protein [Paracoccus amoyensis]MBC9247559.1 carboxymuconolactone decarboxylase family protein [Paracoccus amoyensis]